MDIKYVCSSCFKIYAHATSLRRNVNIYHKNRRHTCEKCQLAFKRVESLPTHERRLHGKTGDYPNPTNRQTTAPLNTAKTEEVFQTPTFELMCTGNLSIHDRRGTNTVQPIEEKTYLQDPVEEDMDFLEDIIEGAQFFVDECAKECAKEEQLWLNKDSLPQIQAILYNNWETPQSHEKTDKLYNHHKCLIFACYKLYKYVDRNKRKQHILLFERFRVYFSISNKTLYSVTSFNAVPCLSWHLLATTGIYIDVGTVLSGQL